MQPLDVVLLMLLALSSVRGYRRGALSLLSGLAGGLAGLFAGVALAPRAASALVGEPGLGLALVTLGILAGTVLLGQALGLAAGHRLRAVVVGIGAAPADRVAGLAAGAVGFVVVLWLAGGVLAQGPWPALGQQLRDSRLVSGVAAVMPEPPDVLGPVTAYLDRHGFPQAFTGLDPVAPPVDPPDDDAVATAAAAATPGTVRVEATGCGGLALGSGFAVPGSYVVTNAHVVAGSQSIAVRDQGGVRTAEAVHVDDQLDLAVLRVAGLAAVPLDWAQEPAERGTAGATLGFPGNGATLEVRPAAVQARLMAVGHDIYGQGRVTREILAVSSTVERGDSGGPFVTGGGDVAGVVFAASRTEPGTGYVLTAESVRDAVAAAIDRDTAVGTGNCRL